MMLTFIFGGSASGKSEYAEQYAASLAHNCNAPLFYLATMCANDTESKQRIERHIQRAHHGVQDARRDHVAAALQKAGKQRIERHRKMRADKSFQTIEVSKAIDSIAVGSDSVVLLECLSNLLANEMFSNNTAAYSVSSLLQQIRHLQSHCQHLIVVSNEIFSDGICYDLSTTQYLSDLGYLHRELCRTANEIYEVVCGIPISYRKGEVI